MLKSFINEGFNLTETQINSFNKYYELLVEYNQKFNLTAITEKDEVVYKHFIDSLYGVELFKCLKVLDIGSGGGFPAIPIKIMNENIHLTMMDATLKKCEFLKTVCRELGLENVTVINGRAEEYAFKEGFRESFDHVSARAVARLNILSEYCLPFVKVGGSFIAYKGDADEELNEGKSAIKTLGGNVKNIVKKELLGAKRQIIEIEKVFSTPIKYPRSNGKIRKNPL
ncbi:MAG: 16S rRNA (guanine(527)-N(7))-methyltransferase RsmG [Clostridia bacterium]|nr:16S rRNA (guanine(527)-N(7))-methyltransferase RsmG [Clostridia bacterium]